uniref:Uncharacterized protein n=1 Tax=Zea mays TaxID=4577 RepID=A0A804QPI2_MAIZE
PLVAYRRRGPRRDLAVDPAAARAALVTCGGLCPGLNTVLRELVVGLQELYGVRHVLHAHRRLGGALRGAGPGQPPPPAVAGGRRGRLLSRQLLQGAQIRRPVQEPHRHAQEEVQGQEGQARLRLALLRPPRRPARSRAAQAQFFFFLGCCCYGGGGSPERRAHGPSAHQLPAAHPHAPPLLRGGKVEDAVAVAPAVGVVRLLRRVPAVRGGERQEAARGGARRRRRGQRRGEQRQPRAGSARAGASDPAARGGVRARGERQEGSGAPDGAGAPGLRPAAGGAARAVLH